MYRDGLQGKIFEIFYKNDRFRGRAEEEWIGWESGGSGCVNIGIGGAPDVFHGDGIEVERGGPENLRLNLHSWFCRAGSKTRAGNASATNLRVPDFLIPWIPGIPGFPEFKNSRVSGSRILRWFLDPSLCSVCTSKPSQEALSQRKPRFYMLLQSTIHTAQKMIKNPSLLLVPCFLALA